MKEYTLIGKRIELEEHFDTKNELLQFIKDNSIQPKHVSQIFYKTYNKNLEEKDCVLLFCRYQKIDNIFN